MNTSSPLSSNGARETIFAAIRQSLNESRPFDADWQKHHRPADLEPENGRPTSAKLPQADLVDNFRQNLEAVAGNCHIVRDRSEATQRVAEIASEIGAKRVAVSDSQLVKDVTSLAGDVEIVEKADAEMLFGCDLGITSAEWAIAETGTLVLESDRERHRLTSLVPPIHICVIEAVNIRRSLGEVLELINRDLSRTVTFITGASRTSDIELTLAIGVHGPEQLHVVVITGLEK